MSIIAWYRDFTNIEIENNQALDKSGNANHGILQNNAAITAVASKGRVIAFPASVASSIEIADSASINPVTAISVGAWIYRIDNSAAIIADKNLAYRLWFPDTNGQLAWDVHIDGSWRSIFSELPIPTQQWVFVQGSYDGASLKLFQHGSERSAAAQAGYVNASTEPLLIGKFLYGGYQFSGYMGEVVVKNTGITLAEHKTDLQRWIKKEAHEIIELLQIKVPGNPINLCTYHQPITVTVYS